MNRFIKLKRRRVQVHPDQDMSEDEEVANYRSMLQQLKTLEVSSFVFNADVKEDFDRLINFLWTGDYSEALASLSACNPESSKLFRLMTTNTYVPRQDASKIHNEQRASREFEAIFTMLCRMQSQKKIPMLTVLLTLRAYKVKCHSRLADALAFFFRGALMSDAWTEKLIKRAVEFDPGPGYEVLDGVSACMFDNLTIRVGYKSYATQTSAGFRLDMTNWVRMPVPKHVGAANFNAAQICA